MRERIGVLGGAFDPPHIGHLLLGETAREQLGLDLVLFLPTGQPPHKRERRSTGAQQRLAMTRLAVEGHPAFLASAIDIERPAPHYTVTLRPYLETVYGQAELVLIIGGDSLRDLPEWREPQQIVAQWQLAVLPRPDAAVDWVMLEREVPGVREATIMLDGPSVALSSTQIRRWVQAGRSLRYLMPRAVAQYIQEDRLYRDGAAQL